MQDAKALNAVEVFNTSAMSLPLFRVTKLVATKAATVDNALGLEQASIHKPSGVTVSLAQPPNYD
jgi:hypothetical protein